ncbi:MAG: FAD-dependent oxidoreductase [Pseudomonadota bacterium]
MAKVGVIGGGAAGLAAASKLLEAGYEVVLFEKNQDLGGRCRTHQWQDEWLIRGAAAFIGGETEIVDMCKLLNIYNPNEIISSREEMEFTVVHPKLGYALLGSFDAASILKSNVLPFSDKVRLGRALLSLIGTFVNAKESDPTSVVSMDDVNACEYFRAYSPAFVDYILEPVMNMYCGYGEDDYSLAWLGWLMASPRSWSASQWTFADRGVGKLTQTMELRLSHHANCSLHLNSTVSRASPTPNGVAVWYDTTGAQVENPSSLELVDWLIVAVPGTIVPEIVPDLPPRFARFFRTVEYVPHHILHMIIDNPPADTPFSLLLPTAEGYHAASNIWLKPASSDPEKTLFYAEVKGDFGRKHFDRDEKFFLESVWRDACKAVPALTECSTYAWHMQRNDIALCSRRKGYTTALREFRKNRPMQRIRFAGDYLINSTVGQAMRSGIDAADSIIGHY